MESKSRPIGAAVAAPGLRRRDLALLLPGLFLLAWAGFTWGGYFWLTGRVQAAAEQAAYAVAAASQDQDTLKVARSAATQALSAPITDLSVDRQGLSLRVQVTFDLSDNPVFAIRGLTPLPSPLIARAAVAPIAAVAAVAADRSAGRRPDLADVRLAGRRTDGRSG